MTMSAPSQLVNTLEIRVLEAVEGPTVWACHIQGDAYSHSASRSLGRELGRIPGAIVMLSPLYITSTEAMIVLMTRPSAVLLDVVNSMLRLILQHSAPMDDGWATATVVDFVGKTGDEPREFALALCDEAAGRFVEAPTMEGILELYQRRD